MPCGFLLLILMYPISGLGQYSITNTRAPLDPNVINSNGGSAIIHQIVFDWNVGDVAATYNIPKPHEMLLTTGFLQSEPDVSLLFKALYNFGQQIKIGPNPFYNEIHISCKQYGMSIISIRVLDSKGSMVKYIKGPFSGLAFEKHIEIQKGKDPCYFVQICYNISNSYSIYKTFKLIQY